MRTTVWLLSVGLLLAGCPSASVDEGEDARAASVDAVVMPRPDAASDAAAASEDAELDAGTEVDAGDEADAEPTTDAEPATDAEPSPDAADTTAPDTRIDLAPPAVGSTRALRVEFSSDDASATFTCALDAQPAAPCTSPLDLLADEGEHTLTITAADGAGNADPTPAVATFTVDLTAPMVTIDSGPSGPITISEATFTFSATETSTFTCALDGAAPATCTSPAHYAMLALGTHTFVVEASDAAGLVSAPVSRTFEVIAVTPETTLVVAPAPIGNSASVRFEFSSDVAGATFECALDTPTFTACTSPLVVTVAAGPHQLAVRARNVTVVDPSPAIHAFTVDLTAPTVSIGSPAANATTGRNVSVTYSAEAGSTVACALDSVTLVACPPSPIAYTNLAGGAHSFSIQATDAAGNTSAVASRFFMVDATAPVITITPLNGNVSVASGHIDFVSSEPGTFACTLDALAVPCTSAGFDFTNLALGNHTVTVRGTDAVGNVGAVASYMFRVAVDTTITVLRRGCPADTGLTVVVQAPDGSVRGSAPGVQGIVVTNLVQDGDMITAVYTDSDNRLETVMDVRAGQAITLGDGNSCLSSAAGFTVRIPAPVAGATYYEVRYGGCNRAFTAAEIGQNIAVNGWAGCRRANGNYTLVARASNINGLYQQSFIRDVVPGSSVVMPAWSNRTAVPATFTNFPAGVFTLDAEIGLRVEGTEVATDQRRAGAANPVAQLAFVTGLGDTYRVFGEARFDLAPNMTSFTGRGFDVPLGPAVTIDMATVLPVLRTLTLDRTNPVRPVVTYTADAPVASDGVLLQMTWTTPTRGRWRIVFPSSMTQVTAPALPAALAGVLPSAASAYTIDLEHAEHAAVNGWDQMRTVYRQYLDGFAEASSGAHMPTPVDTRSATIHLYP